MKEKINKRLVLPMLYGILSGWIIGGGISIALLLKYSGIGLQTMILASSALILMAVIPALARGAWVYSNLRRYHTAEYFYNLGNGLELTKAIAQFERRVNKAVMAWIKRMILRHTFNVVIVAYIMLVIQSGSWLASLWVFAAVLVIILAVFIGMWTMLFTARRLSYDRYGNIKNA